MSAPHSVTADALGVERFAYQLFCRAADESPHPRPSLPHLQAAALNPDRLHEALDPPEHLQGFPPVQPRKESPEEPRAFLRGRSASIPLAYRVWLTHLLWLEDVLHTVACRPAELTAAELTGLQALNRARSRFLRAHQFCPHCDALNPRVRAARGKTLGRCRRCHQEL
ncbi:MAG: hypothetical protein ACE5IP_12385 [Terriglobia bacterium]